jgi:hypothetical protein
VASDRCSDSGAIAHPNPRVTVRLFARHHRDHVRLGLGESVRVVTHDHSYLGTPAATEKPHSRVLCQESRTGDRHQKVVIFRAIRVGHTYVDASPRVVPGMGAATELLSVRVH